MELHNSANSSTLSSAELARREMELRRDDVSDVDVPEHGRESSSKVTQVPDDLEVSGELASQVADNPKPGAPTDSVDNVDDAGLDGTRDPDWRVVEDSALPPEPGPGDAHNPKYWEENSEDVELQDVDLQEKLIREDMESFERAAEPAEDFSRPNNNPVLDPYYRAGDHPSNPPSAGTSLDSFA